MGRLSFDCLTTDADATTFYGMIIADDYAINKYPNRFTKVVAVVKSNTSPASPLSMTWSVVSKIGYESLTGQITQLKYVPRCAINSKGVFSILVHLGFQSSGSSGPVGPRVYQYDPNGKTMDASFNYKGTGSWSNVTVDTVHPTMTGTWFTPRLQYVYNGQVETLILSFIGDGFNVELGVLNEATNTLAHAATWKMNGTLYGEYPDDALISGDRLYTITEGSSPDHPLPFPSTTRDPGSVLISQTHYVDVAATLRRAVNVSRDIYYKQYFVPINRQFALIKINDQMDAITLSGSSFGNFYSDISINISDSIDPNFKFEAVQSSGGSKIGLIAGVTAAVVVLIGAGIGYFFWRKRSSKRAAGAADDITAAPALPPKDHAYIQGRTLFQKIEPVTDAGYGGRPIAYDQSAGFIGATTAAPTTATTTVQGPQGQTFQDYMQGFQLSNHIVTTGATADPDEISGAAVASQAPEQPTPFIPPTELPVVHRQ
ncbi:hypothetical protein BGZ82_001756 [Podila clonocystis]|nr:hypothetical protein BGZ82_001756 [Podila clonocystis]